VGDEGEGHQYAFSRFVVDVVILVQVIFLISRPYHSGTVPVLVLVVECFLLEVVLVL